TGAGPRTLATLRNLAISLFRRRGCTSIASALRAGAWDCSGALELVGLRP
ncbi:MAG TPA: ISAs1 family transposase, partial [Clostridiales bacterium UBA8153]|nr:ISAs1 family transposase [Clostridiales bacterium UBA8153]